MNLRMLCQRYLQIDDELVDLHHKINESYVKSESHIFVREYLKKYIEREDLKSGMRRYLINELLNGVEFPTEPGLCGKTINDWEYF